MKTTLLKIILFVPFLLQVTLSQLHAQAPPPKAWDRSFGGAADDYLEHMVPTQDGGYLLAGYSASGGGSTKMGSSFGGNDFWVVKMRADGTKAWDKSYGGNRDDILKTITATKDGGFLLGGYSESGASHLKTEASRGNYDYWVIKVNKDGDKEWDKSFGTANYDYLESVVPTPDGGYLLGGHTEAGVNGDKTGQSKGALDYWIVKIAADGRKVWDKTYGGSGGDILTSIIPVASGGYLLGGTSLTGGGFDKSGASKGSGDYWIIKIGEDGEKLWDRTFGGNGFNVFVAMLEVPGGFLLAGHTDAGIGHDKTEASLGENDYWVVKIDPSGNKVWDKAFGGSLNEHVYTLVSTKDGAFMIGGHSYSGISGHKSEASRGSADYWVVKFDQEGRKIWDKTLGSADGDYLTAIISLDNDNYLLGGMSLSGTGGDKASINLGVADYWVVKLGQTETTTPPSQPTTPTIPGGPDPFCLPSVFKLHPNPTMGMVRFSTSDECLTLPPFSLTVTNPIGQVLLRKDAVSSTDVVDLSGLASGLYLFVLTFEDKQRIVEKIVKVN
jgi:hypothetical protein